MAMILSMAWRNIWRNRTRSIVIMLSVAIGLFAGLEVLALYKGMMTGRIRTVIEAETGHLQIHHPSFKKDYHPIFILPEAESILHKVQQSPGVKTAAPRSVTQGMLSTTTGSTGVQIIGVLPEKEYLISGLKKKIREGKEFSPDKKNEIIVSRKLAEKMKLKNGSKLVLTFTDTADNIVSSAFRVNALYQSDNASLDELNVYVHISTLNELLLTRGAFHEIAVLLDNDDSLQTAAVGIQSAFPTLLIETWKEITPETDLMVKTVDEYSLIIISIILIALAFGILNTMLMSVLERTKEIGMMMALGTSKGTIFSLVFWETAILTIAGTPIGILAAWAITAYFNTHGLDLSGRGDEMMSSFGFTTMIYPSFPVEKIPEIIGMVVATAILSCLLPAIKALRLSPVEALRR